MNTNKYYGQTSRDRTLNLCHNLNGFQDIPAVVEGITTYFFPSESFDENYEKNKSLLSSRDYTNENIDQALEVVREGMCKYPRYRHTREDRVANEKLFERSIQLVENYLGYQEDNIKSYDRFCLELFLARLSSQLNRNQECIRHYELALKILKNASYRKENWGDLSLESANEGYTFLNQKINFVNGCVGLKLARHRLMSHPAVTDINRKRPVSLEMALLSRSFFNPKQSWSDYIKDGPVSALRLHSVFNSLRSTEFSKRIMRLNALDALEDSRFSILFDLENGIEGGGVYNSKNTIRIQNRSRMAGILFHELTHKGMDKVFYGVKSSLPYAEGDMNAKDAYRESMKRVLLNFIDAVIPISELVNLDCNTDYETDMVDSRQGYYNSVQQKFNFPCPWSRDMALDQLVKNCFLENGLFTNQKSVEYFTRGGCLMLNGQTLWKGESERTGRPDTDYICLLGSRLQAVFCSYNISDLDVEFITNVTDSMLDRPPEDLVIIKPLLDYIETYINPAIDEYIINHPNRNRIDDTNCSDKEASTLRFTAVKRRREEIEAEVGREAKRSKMIATASSVAGLGFLSTQQVAETFTEISNYVATDIFGLPGATGESVVSYVPAAGAVLGALAIGGAVYSYLSNRTVTNLQVEPDYSL